MHPDALFAPKLLTKCSEYAFPEKRAKCAQNVRKYRVCEAFQSEFMVREPPIKYVP